MIAMGKAKTPIHEKLSVSINNLNKQNL
jgi:hypothetical protein